MLIGPSEEATEPLGSVVVESGDGGASIESIVHGLMMNLCKISKYYIASRFIYQFLQALTFNKIDKCQ